MEYKVAYEYSAPDYYDNETGEKLYESCDASTQCYWVVSYDPEEEEIIEWIERFDNPDEALKYKISLEVQNA